VPKIQKGDDVMSAQVAVVAGAGGALGHATTVTLATFPAEMIAHAVAPGAIADAIAFLVSDAAAPVSGAILPAYGPSGGRRAPAR
jgi:hypothetical protein